MGTIFTENLYNYIQDISVREHPVLKALREETSLDKTSHLQSAPEQAQFIAFLAKLINAKKIIEIGTYSGYTTLALALSTSFDTKIITCDLDKDCLKTAKCFWDLAQVSSKILLRIGKALNTLTDIMNKGEEETFDLIFIDADKLNYRNYYELSLKLIKTGGLIVLDNTLWKGDVCNSDSSDKRTIAIRELNEFLKNDERVDISLVAIRDGITLVRKRS